jgi:hypothetical protein
MINHSYFHATSGSRGRLGSEVLVRSTGPEHIGRY